MTVTPFALPALAPAGYRNIFEFGWVPGSDVSPAVNSAVAAGENVYFPGGYTYEFYSKILLTSKNDLAFFGDGRTSNLKVHSSLAASHIFELSSCNNIDFFNLRFEGRGPFDANAMNQENAIWSLNCTDLSIERCGFTRFGGNTVICYTTDGLYICGNKFWRNEVLTWDDGAISSADLVIHNSPRDNPTKDVHVMNNRMLSNNRLGIAIFHYAGSVNVSNNIVVSRIDATGLEATNASPPSDFRRKEGITLVYDGEMPVDSEWQIVCSGNIIRNCAWNGIYINWDTSIQGDWGHDGPFAIINNNMIRRVCMDVVAPGLSVGNQAGISVLCAQSVQVNNNIIEGVNLNNTATVAIPAGIRYRTLHLAGIWSGTRRSLVTIQGNHIRDVCGPGIDMTHEQGTVNINGNTVIDANPNIQAYSEYTQASVVYDLSISDNILEKVIRTTITSGIVKTWTVNTTTDVLTVAGYSTAPAMSVSDGSAIYFTNTGGALPTTTPVQIVAGSPFYVRDSGTGGVGTFRVTNTVGGTALDFTGAGTGTHSVAAGQSGYCLHVLGNAASPQDKYRLSVIGNRLKTAAAMSGNNELFRMSLTRATVTNNWFEGISTATTTGVRLLVPDATIRRTNAFTIGLNHFYKVQFGYNMTGGALNYGPFIDQGSTFESVGTRYGGWNWWGGQMMGDNANIMATAAPTYGWWNRGDMAWNSAPANGSPRGWVCTVTGTPGTWVTMGNL